MSEMNITPYLCVHDGKAAIDFCRRAFGAEETGPRFTDADGRIGHAEISIGGARLFLSDEYCHPWRSRELGRSRHGQQTLGAPGGSALRSSTRAGVRRASTRTEVY